MLQASTVVNYCVLPSASLSEVVTSQIPCERTGAARLSLASLSGLPLAGLDGRSAEPFSAGE